MSWDQPDFRYAVELGPFTFLKAPINRVQASTMDNLRPRHERRRPRLSMICSKLHALIPISQTPSRAGMITMG